MNDRLKYNHIMGSKSILILILLISIAIVFYGRRLDANAQDTKGGSEFSSVSSSSNSIKGGGGGGQFSRFKENIISIQQQQLARQPVQVVKENVERVQSSSFVKLPSPPVATSVSSSFKNSILTETSSQQTTDSEPTIYGSVEGVPGIDFPGFTTIPNTQFSCEGRPFDPGMYADESTGCQVYHLCYLGRRESFLCGIGTVFNQAIMNCDFWHSVDCSKSSDYYHLNSEFGKASAETGVGGSSSFSSKQELSSSFNRIPAVPVGGSKTSFSSEKFSTSVRINPLPPPPPPTFISTGSFTSRVESSSGKISPPKISTLQNAFSAVKGGSSSFRSANSFVSPGRQVQQLNRQFGAIDADTSGQLAASASSNRFKVNVSKTGGSSASSADLKQTTDEIFSTKTSSSANEIQPVKSADEWKPYFKSKPKPAATASSSSSSEQPAKPSGDFNQDPVFSQAARGDSKPAANGQVEDEPPKVPKSGSPPETTTTGSPAVSVSVESDVKPELAATTPVAPEPSSAGSAGGGEVSTTSTTTTTTTTTAAASTTGAPETSELTTSGGSGGDQDGSSVEYASSNSGSAATTTTTAAPSSADEAAKRKRKRKKKKRNERNSAS